MSESSRAAGGSRHRICARCGSVAIVRHYCRGFSPARAAAAADVALPADASLEDFHRLLAGAPFEVARVLACLPADRREQLYSQLRLDADQAREEAA